MRMQLHAFSPVTSLYTMHFPVSVILVKILLGFGLCDHKPVEQSFPRVATPLGTVEGYYKTSNNGRRYEAYEGIRYAEPPIGESRFRVAKSIAPWTGVRLAKSFGPVCMQYSQASSTKVLGSEDCLYMNIYTAIGDKCRKANGKSANLLPVIVYIHGGAFFAGSGSENGPKYLLDRDVIVVTFNYRLGPLGFLSTGDETVCGNMGLKDQVIALRWVEDNIESFGGNPSRITIFGASAGGASVHYHYLSKLTAGLFQRGMSMSGTALNSWAQMECSLEKAKKLSAIVGCPTDNVSSMVECLRNRPALRLVQPVGEFMPWLNTPSAPFGPVVEKEGCEFTFIDRSPIEIIDAGEAHDLPWITGVVSEEGLAVAAAFAVNDSLLEYLNDHWATPAPYMLDYNNTVPRSDQSKVARLAREHYLGTSPISRSTLNQTVQLIGDRLMVYDVGESALLQARIYQSPVRFYKFSYRGAHSFSELSSGSSKNFGVSHMDDIAYVFDLDINTSTTSEDRAMQQKLIDLWVSYATCGTPDVGANWPALRGSRDQLNYLHIAGPSEMGMESSLDFGERNFWESLGIQENKLTQKGNACGLNCF